MGVWQGIYEAHLGIVERKDREKELQQAREDRARERQEDRDDANSRFNREILERRKDAMLKLLQEKEEQEKALLQQVRLARGYGLSEFAAKTLQSTGELDIFLRRAEESEVPREFLESLETVVKSKYPDNPELVSRVMLEGASNSEVGKGNEAKTSSEIALTILNATTEEQLSAVRQNLGTSGVAYQTPVGINFAAMEGPSLADSKAISNEIARGLKPYFNDAFEQAADGSLVLTQSAPRDVVSLVNKAEDAARSMAYTAGLGSSMNPSNAANAVARNIETALRNAPVGVDILPSAVANFDFMIANPQGFVEQLSASSTPAETPPPVNPQGAAAQASADVGNIAQGVIDASGVIQNTPSSNGFNFDVDDVVRKNQ
jgi:hypothetical protein